MAALVLPVEAGAAPAPKSPTAGLTKSAAQLRATAAKRFAKGRKRRLVALARRGARAARRGRACPALRATEELRSALKDRRTWRGRKLPRRLARRLDRTLRPASRRLFRRAGRCAKRARKKRVRKQRATGGYTPLPAPSKVHLQGNVRDHLGTGVGRFRPVRRPGPASTIGPDPRAQAAARRPRGVFSQDIGGLRFFRIADVGTPTRLGVPQEPTSAVGRDVVWFTGNSSVAYSLNRGRTFTVLDPSTVLPDDGLPFCCDQVVSYSPEHNLFVWLLQYWCSVGTSQPPNTDCRVANTGSNRLRIAVASPEAIRANTANPSAAWRYVDLPPSLFGLASGVWFDYNDLAVDPTYATFTSNPNRGGPGGSLVARVSLRQLKRDPAVDIEYFFDGRRGNLKAAQNMPYATTLIAGNESLSEAHVWHWPRNSSILTGVRIPHTTVPIFNKNVNGTDGSDWYDRYGIFPGQLAGATVRQGQLWVAWGTGRAYCTAQCGPMQTPQLDPVFPHPTIQLAIVDMGRWRVEREDWLWSPALAFGYPSLATNGAGDVGISFVASTVPGNALPVAGFLSGGQELMFALPSSEPYTAGDYYSLRPGASRGSFVFGGYSRQNDPNGINWHWHHIEYGRGPAPQFHPPAVDIVSPLDGRQFTQGQAITYEALAFDPQDGQLPADAIVWREDGNVIGRGRRITRSGTPVGTHTIQVTATNGERLSASDQITISVVPAQAGAPTAQIHSPADNSSHQVTGADAGGEYADIAFSASASDPDGDALTYRWTDSVNGGPPQQVSTELSPTLRLRLLPPGACTATHDLALEVSDGTHTTSVPIRVYVYHVC